MKITDAFADLRERAERAERQRVEPPAAEPVASRSLVGPEVITGTVQFVDPVKRTCRLDDDPMGRTHYYGDGYSAEIETAYRNTEPVKVTVEKLQGKWTVTGLEKI